MNVAGSSIAACGEFRVGEWVVQADRGQLIGQRGPVLVEPRVMQLLVYLAERAGQVISADQLLIDIWRGAFYGDNPVHKCVAMLRKALGDDAQAPSYIQTLRKRGYRMIAAVSMPEEFVADDRTASPRPWRGESPYVGLRAFSAAEFALYFGRTRALAGLLGTLREQWERRRNLLMVVGPSGIGKSSLLRAGLLPRLQHPQGFDGLRILGHRWVDIARECAAGDLAHSLGEIDSGLSAQGASTEGEELRPGAIAQALVVDHLEALVHSATDPDQRLIFDQLLARWSEREDLLVFLVARSDAYAALLEALPNLAELKAGSGHFDVPPVGRGEIAEMIRGPARLAALSFEFDPHSRVRLDDALLGEAAEHPACLPLLQYTLQQLYDRRDPDGRLSFAAYGQIGGLTGAIASRAESVFRGLDSEAQSTLPMVLSKLVRIEASGDLLSGRSVDRASIAGSAADRLIAALVDARLLIASQWRGRPCLQLAHDALLREWPRAHAWAQQNRQLLSARERLQAAAERWQAQPRSDLLLPAGQPLEEALAVAQAMPDGLRESERNYVQLSQQRELRLRRWRWAGLAALLLSVLASLTFAQQAREARAIAEQQRRDSESLVDFLLDDLSERLRAVGRLDLLGSVTEQVSSYFDQAHAPDLPADRLRRARALRNLAEVSVGQGRTAAAGEAIGAALKLLHGMPPGAQRNSDFDLELGNTQYWRGYLALQQGDSALAREAWDGYRQSAERMLARDPSNAEAQLELSYALNNLGSLALSERRLEQAAALIERSITLKRALYQRDPGRSQVVAELADSLSWLGSIREQQGDLQAAVTLYRDQRALLEPLAEATPQDRLWGYRLTTATTHLGLLQLALGHAESAAELLARSAAQLAALVNADTSNRLWQRDLAFTLLQQGWLDSLQERPEAAEQLFDQADGILEELLTKDPGNLDWQLLRAQLQLRRLANSSDAAVADQREYELTRIAAQLRQLCPRPEEDLDCQLSLVLALFLQSRAASTNPTAPLRQAVALLEPLLARGQDKRVLALWVLLHADDPGLATAAQEKLNAMGYRHPELARFRSL